jgi:uncharacterized protein involved in exopolysaccharide biosynthesis
MFQKGIIQVDELDRRIAAIDADITSIQAQLTAVQSQQMIQASLEARQRTLEDTLTAYRGRLKNVTRQEKRTW